MSEYTEKLSILAHRIGKDKKALLIIVAALIGMFLILFSGENKTGEEFVGEEYKTEFTRECEDKLQRLISKIEGVGKVSVMITYESGEESVFASDKEESFRNGEQKVSNDYIIVDGDKGETGLKIKSIYPEVKGVAVVCGGASDPIVKERIISVVSALFNISTKNISVVCAEN